MSSKLDDKYSTGWCEHLQLAGLPQGLLLAVEGLGQDLVPGGLSLPQLEPVEVGEPGPLGLGKLLTQI